MDRLTQYLPDQIPPDHLAIYALGAVLILLLALLVRARTARVEAHAIRQAVEIAQAEAHARAVEIARLSEAIAARDHSAARLEQDVATLRPRADEATRLATAETHMKSLLAEIGERMTALDQELRDTRADADARRAKIAELETALRKEREASTEKVELLSQVRQDMQDRFKQLADETMRRHGEQFKASNIERLDAMLKPFKENIGRFETELKTATQDAVKERVALKTEIEQLTRRSEQVSQEAVNLTRALKGDQQKQGAWGEMILESLLERSGLEAGTHYDAQSSYTGDEGQRLRPDVVIKLPDEKRLIIDSKVSLTAYERAVNAEDDVDATQSMRAHVQSLRTHITGLSAKDYAQVTDGLIDYVIMFIPIEGAFSEALRADGAITAFAAEKNIIIATPTTLMGMLKTINNFWSVVQRNKNAEEIAKRAGKLYDKFVGFADALEQVGVRLRQATDEHDKAMGRLSQGAGNVIGQVEKLKALGAMTTKSIGQEFDAEEEGVVDRAVQR
jgi:DNA recombination protein RmuC